MTLLLSLAALLPRILLGFCIVHGLWSAVDGRALLVKVFLSAGIGFGVSSLFAFLWIWIGLPLSTYAILESVFALGLTGWLLFKDRDILRLSKPTDWTNKIWGWILTGSVLVFMLNLALYSRQYPHGRPDAWINWNVVARFIYLGGADWQATFLRQFDHPDYPLFMAMNHAVTWVFVGGTSTWSPIAFHFFISFFTAGLLFALVNSLRDFKQASLAVALFASLPFLVDQGMRQYADLLLAYLILAACGATLLYMQTKEARLALLSGLLIGLGGWAKNEGLAAILVCTLVWVFVARRVEWAALKSYAIGLLFPLLIIILFKLLLAPSNDLLSAQVNPFDNLLNLERYRIILREGGIMLWKLGGTPVSLIGLIIFVALLIGRAKRPLSGTWTIAMMIILQLAVYFGIYLLTPLELTYHLKTSLDRLYLHVFPLALLWFFVWLKSPQELP